MFDQQKEVYFETYCPRCEFYLTHEDEEPCYECLTHGFNYNSHKPVEYKEKELKTNEK